MKTTLALSVIAAIAGSAVAQPTYSVITGGTFVAGMTADGSTCGVRSGTTAALWTASGGAFVLPAPGTSGGSPQSSRLSADGLAFTSNANNVYPDIHPTTIYAGPALWTQATNTWTPLPLPSTGAAPSGTSLGIARGLSGNAAIVVGRINTGPSGVHAFMWEASTNTTTDLTFLFGTGASTDEAITVSDNGRIIIGSHRYNVSPDARAWFVDLNAPLAQIRLEPGNYSLCSNVNNDGTKIIGVGATGPVMWTTDYALVTNTQTFTAPASHPNAPRLHDLSDDGTIVVGQASNSPFPNSGINGMIWINGVGQSIKSYFISMGVANLPAGDIGPCTFVSADGTAFAGTASGFPAGSWYVDLGVGCGVTCDYNQDGGGDTTDVIELADAIASGTDPYPASCKDFNQDGGADTTDVIEMADAIASGTCP